MIRSFANVPCYTGQTEADECITANASSSQNLAGKTLSNAPPLELNLGATLDLPLADTGWTTSTNVHYQYQTKVNLDLLQNPRDEQKAYDQLPP